MEWLKKFSLYDLVISASIIVGVNNLVKGIGQDRTLFYFILNVILFFVIALISIIAKRKNKIRIIAIIVLIIGLITTLTAETNGNTSGIFYIVSALHIYKTKKSNFIICIVMTIFIMLRSVLYEFTIEESFNLLIAHAILLFVYYILFYPKKIMISGNGKIKEEMEIVLTALSEGKKYKQISELPKVDLSPEAIRSQMVGIRKRFRCDNNEQLMRKLFEQGFFVKR